MVQHLSQVIATEKTDKDKAAQQLSHAQGIFGQTGPLLGIARNYTPKHEDGEQFPPESTRVRYKVPQILKDVQSSLVTLFDTIATKDYTNCTAKADVVVEGETLLKAVPTTYILFLEKQLAELLSFAKKIPVLDTSETWHYDASQDCYASEPSETIRTKKVPRAFVLAEATDKHPAQVQPWQEDIPEGRWRVIKYSGAIPAKEANEIIGRIEKLQRAVKHAREEANRTTAQTQEVGAKVLKYIFVN